MPMEKFKRHIIELLCDEGTKRLQDLVGLFVTASIGDYEEVCK